MSDSKQSLFLSTEANLKLGKIPEQNWYTNLPEWVSFLREDLEVFFSELNGGQCLQPEVSPTLDKLHQRLKGVETKPVVAIIR